MENPTGMTIDSSTGLVTWDTTGRADGIWATNVTIEELDGVVITGKTSADFITAVGNYELPTWQAGAPVDGTGFVLDFGEAFTLVLGADAPAGKNVTPLVARPPRVAHLSVPRGRRRRGRHLHRHGPDCGLVLDDRVHGHGLRRPGGDAGVLGQRAAARRGACPQPAPPSPAAEPIPSPAPLPVVSLAPAPAPLLGSAPTTLGVVASRDIVLTVDVGAERFVLVSTSADMHDAVRVPVGPDGTVHYSLPGTGQGMTTVYVQRESGGLPAATSLVVDTIKPRLLRAILVSRVALTSVPVKVGRNRYFIRLEGIDEETGIQSLQLSPKAGVDWRWRGILTNFSALVTGKTVRVRVADAAGNTSDWLVVPLKKLTTP